ncbi:MAG: ester cyclase [Dehalococcoidia bacterium]
MHEALVKKYWDLLMGGDPSGIDAVASPNLEMSVSGARLPSAVTLPIRAAMLRQAFPDARATYTILHSSRDGVTLEYATEGTHLGPFMLGGQNLAATGNKISYSGMAFLRIADGRVVEERSYPDSETLRRQMRGK